MAWYSQTKRECLLSSIGRSLIPKGLAIEKVSWRFRMLRDPQPTPFALPNGTIYSTGLVTLIDNESQLAAIIAHELTHVMRRHTYLQNRSNRKKFLTLNIMSAVGFLCAAEHGWRGYHNCDDGCTFNHVCNNVRLQPRSGARSRSQGH